jgi:hypothetical protein
MSGDTASAFCRASILVLLGATFATRAATAGDWSIERSKRRVISRPVGSWSHEKVAVYVVCASGRPQFVIQVRDPVAAKPEVTLQFGGHSGRAIVFVGHDGVVRKYSGFTQGENAYTAVATFEDSRLIVAELRRGHSRIAWIVDTTGDGLDSLEVPATAFANAWAQLQWGR